MRVPIYDPRAEYLELKEPIDAAIRDVLESGNYTVGPHVEAFEAELAAFVGVPHSVGVASGSAALELSLAACGVGPGDEVITAPNTDISTAAAITHRGAKVVFADIEPSSFVIDPNEIEKKLTKATRAIVPVHLFGHVADMDAIGEIAAARGLGVIEDATLAIGGEWRGRKAGTTGDIGCYSMNSRKLVAAFGDAGAIVTSSPELAAAVRSLKDYGKDPAREKTTVPGAIEFHYEGFNARLDELQAAVLRVKLEAFPRNLARRREIAARYETGLRDQDILLPSPSADVRHAFRAYTVRVSDRLTRDRLVEQFNELRIDPAIYYAPPLHLQPAYRYLGYATGDFPVTESVADSMLSLPIHPTLSNDQVDFVIAALENLLLRHGSSSS